MTPEAIAGAVKASLESLGKEDSAGRGAVITTALQLSLVCAGSNDRFDRKRFLHSCGLNGYYFDAAMIMEGVAMTSETITGAVKASLESLDKEDSAGRGAVAMTALQLALVCAENNDRFDRARFLSSCGFGGL